jgi:hypothetical protein
MSNVENNLPTFINNETKTFKFTNEQYYNLELEYNRYIIYKSLIKQIEKIVNISGTDTSEYNSNNSNSNNSNNNNNNNNRKKYENKNIIDRFILECINHGITPYIEDPNQNPNQIPNQIPNTEINYDILSSQLFFNQTLDNSIKLRNTNYYKKMLCEYNEKKIRLAPEKIVAFDKVFIDSNKLFIRQNQLDVKNTQTTNTKPQLHSKYKGIVCSITIQNKDFFIIKYRDYYKIISINRYYKLIKNYDKPFPYDIIRMLLRYSIFDMSSQQWSIGDNLYDDISDIFNISFEMFASPLNFNMNMFCSIFYDTDHIFGSLGSFYSLDLEKLLNQNIKGVFFNPPYLPLLMSKCTIHCLNILDEMNKLGVDFTIVSFLPNWDDADYIKNFSGSKYTVETRIVNKGKYILHEKDKGKLINGTFDLLVIVLNSVKFYWNDEKKCEITKGIDKIVEIMNQESRDAFRKK